MAREEGGVSERWRRWGGWLGWGLGWGGGVPVGAGLAFPQWVACGRYCLTDAGAGKVRSWCGDTVPSICLFLQERNGLFSILPPPTLWSEIN